MGHGYDIVALLPLLASALLAARRSLTATVLVLSLIGVASMPGILARSITDNPLEYDLRLMSWGDGSGVPTSGNSLVLVGTDAAGLLRIRIFDAGGNRITDTDERHLPGTQAGAISALKQQLPGFLPPYVLTGTEKAQVIQEVTSILGQTHPLAMHFREIASLMLLAQIIISVERRRPGAGSATEDGPRRGDRGTPGPTPVPMPTPADARAALDEHPDR